MIESKVDTLNVFGRREMQKKNEDHFKSQGLKWVERAYHGDAGSIAFDRLQCALGVVDLLGPKSLLDVGCGDGRFLSATPPLERKVGVDHSEEMLGLARANCSGKNIELAQFDFNTTDKPLSEFGTFDLVTMLGVIHYLTDVASAVKSIKAASSNWVLITFRNRLFNIAPTSAYRDSAATNRDRDYLESEVAFWTQDTIIQRSFEIGEARRKSIYDQSRQMGFTDPDWNPHGLVHWKQFTPAEAIVLLECAELKPNQILPLNIARDSTKSSWHLLLPACTSFMIVASRTAAFKS